MLWLHSGAQMCSKSQITISQPSKTKATNWVETKQISKIKNFLPAEKLPKHLRFAYLQELLFLPTALLQFLLSRLRGKAFAGYASHFIDLQTSHAFQEAWRDSYFWELWYQMEQFSQAAFSDLASDFGFRVMEAGAMFSSSSLISSSPFSSLL